MCLFCYIFHVSVCNKEFVSKIIYYIWLIFLLWWKHHFSITQMCLQLVDRLLEQAALTTFSDLTQAVDIVMTPDNAALQVRETCDFSMKATLLSLRMVNASWLCMVYVCNSYIYKFQISNVTHIFVIHNLLSA